MKLKFWEKYKHTPTPVETPVALQGLEREIEDTKLMSESYKQTREHLESLIAKHNAGRVKLRGADPHREHHNDKHGS